MATDNRGFRAMDSEEHKAASAKGGSMTGAKNLEKVDRSAAGRKGAQAQSKQAKAKGGRH